MTPIVLFHGFILTSNKQWYSTNVIAVFLEDLQTFMYCLVLHTSGRMTYAWASYQIRNIVGCACARNAGNVFLIRRFRRKPLVSDPSMHHGTCVTHVPWCMSGSLTRACGGNVPGIPGACGPIVLRIWQEVHCWKSSKSYLVTYKHKENVMDDKARYMKDLST